MFISSMIDDVEERRGIFSRSAGHMKLLLVPRMKYRIPVPPMTP
jgi:hypothetical protein